jgi:hypothetical protein
MCFKNNKIMIDDLNKITFWSKLIKLNYSLTKINFSKVNDEQILNIKVKF